MTGKIIKVIQYGLGPIGIECAKWVLKKKGMKIVGAVDIDPEKVGKKLVDILGVSSDSDIIVSDDAEAILSETGADIAILTTQSFLKSIFPQLEMIIKAGVNVVSSTEELLLPSLKNPIKAKELDWMAKENGVTVLGTGVNPGFVMDALPLFLSSMCLEVESIKVRRYLDAATRRLPLQKKVGGGLTVEEFEDLKKEKKIGHRGLPESMNMILNGLSWKPDEIIETLNPMIAPRDIETKYFSIKKGGVAGIKHISRALKDGKEIVSLDLRMYIGAPESYDLVEIEGTPPIKAKFAGGIAGDSATVAALINAVPRVVETEPGLVTMKDLRLPHAFI